MSRIVIANVYSYKNKGDAAIVIALCQEMHRVFPNYQLLLQSADPLNDNDKYGEVTGKSLLWIVLSSKRNFPAIISYPRVIFDIIIIVAYLIIFKYLHMQLDLMLNKDLKVYMRDISSASFILGCGGGYLRTKNSTLQETILLLVTAINLCAAKFMKKRVYLYSQSIGPVYGSIQKLILKWTLNNVDIIEPREDISYQLVKSYQPNAKIIQTSDAVFTLVPNEHLPTTSIKQSQNIKIGVTVRRWFKKESEFEQYLEVVSKTLRYLIEKYNADVYCLPQVIATDFGDDDRVASHYLSKLVKNKKFIVIEDNLHPFELIAMCKKMNIFLGTRMHSNIFALIAETPVIAIEYEHKTRGIMRDMNLEEYTFDIKNLNSDELINAANTILLNPDIYKLKIQVNLKNVRKTSRLSADVIYENESMLSEVNK